MLICSVCGVLIALTMLCSVSWGIRGGVGNARSPVPRRARGHELLAVPPIQEIYISTFVFLAPSSAGETRHAQRMEARGDGGLGTAP